MVPVGLVSRPPESTNIRTKGNSCTLKPTVSLNVQSPLVLVFFFFFFFQRSTLCFFFFFPKIYIINVSLCQIFPAILGEDRDLL